MPKAGQTKRRSVSDGVATGIFLGASVSVGCDMTPPDMWKEHPDIAVLTHRQGDCAASARATFAVRSVRTMDRNLPVASIVPVATDTSVIATAEGNLYVLVADSLVRWPSDPVATVQPSTSATAVAVTREGEVMELALSGGRLVSRAHHGTRLPTGWDAVESVAGTNDAVWVIAKNVDHRVLYRERRGSNGTSQFKAVRRFDVPVWIRSVSDAVVAVGTIESPFSIWLVASDESTVGRFRFRGGQRAKAVQEGRWVSLGVWPLDCGTMVQVLADLTSRLRRIAFHRLERDGSIVAYGDSVIDQPFGVVASYPDERTIITLTDRGDSWELQYIDWSWSANTTSKGASK